MAMERLAIGATVAALGLASCGSSNESPPLKEVPPPAVTSSAPAAEAPAGNSVGDSAAELPPRAARALAPLMSAEGALGNSAAAVARAATDAQALADKVAAGYNAPSGSAPPVARLRNALSAFGEQLRTMTTATTSLPQLSAQLQLRARQLAKRHAAQSAKLLTAKQQVDTAIAELGTFSRDIDGARAEVDQQLSRVSLDGNALTAAVTSGTQNTNDAVAKVSDAVAKGISALAAST